MDLIRKRLRVRRWLLTDRVRSGLMPALSRAAEAGYHAVRPWNPPQGLRLLLAAHRYGPSDRLTSRVRGELPAILGHVDRLLDGPRAKAESEDLKHASRRSLVLKWPRRGPGDTVEKGVLLVTFTTTFPYFHHWLDLDLLQRWFTIVLEPSWAGYCIGEILFWVGKNRPPVIVQATEKTDFEFIARLGTNLVPVDFGASNWVDHRVFRKLESCEKKYDAVYIANYKPIKRHHVLFRAMAELADPGYRLALICTPWGGTKQTVFDLMDYYGVRKNIVVFEGLPAHQVNEVLNASKVSVLLSLKEGSNRSLFEAFFADVPGILLSRNVGVNKRYFNEHTGRLIQEDDLAQTLRYFREHWQTFHPRAWALENISAPVTTQALEQVLRKAAQQRGEPWSEGLRVKVNRPEVEYLEGAARDPLSLVDLLHLFVRPARHSVAEIEQQLGLADMGKGALGRVAPL
jgi:glycosyltransferase involved in cell wall biosynthesis